MALLTAVVCALPACGGGSSPGNDNRADGGADAAARCGDGVRQASEECDGEDLGGEDCESAAGLGAGTLGCTAQCFLDRSACHSCGDGVLQVGEACDGSALGGATCLAVLTDTPHFGGSVSDLQMAWQACSLPVLRKDFTVSALNVIDARLMGADCVLLIAAALDRSELVDFHRLAVEIGLDVLVEIHDESELGAALDAGATLIGVNQRDLVTFDVDHERAERMADVIPSTAVKVAESGVRSRGDAQRLEAAGYDAVLVGETLVTSEDPAAAIGDLIG